MSGAQTRHKVDKSTQLAFEPVLGKHDECLHLCAQVPHQPGVVDVGLDRRLVPGVEEDRRGGVGGGCGEVEASVLCGGEERIVNAEPLREAAGARTEVIQRL